MWSGWGVRTLSSDHPAYNPFSYQTGSVWPHDNAMIAGGFRRYGFDAEAARVAKGTFDAADRLSGYRLPELFAGLCKSEASFPVQYPGANVPQAWAAGAVIRLIAILAGIHATTDASGSRIYVNPALPDVAAGGDDPQPPGRERVARSRPARRRGRGPVEHDAVRGHPRTGAATCRAETAFLSAILDARGRRAVRARQYNRRPVSQLDARCSSLRGSPRSS